jgi:hypothetical protein
VALALAAVDLTTVEVARSPEAADLTMAGVALAAVVLALAAVVLALAAVVLALGAAALRVAPPLR